MFGCSVVRILARSSRRQLRCAPAPQANKSALQSVTFPLLLASSRRWSLGPRTRDTATQGGALTRQLGLASVTALVIGEVIGVGIFLTPASMARSLGSPLWLLVTRSIARRATR